MTKWSLIYFVVVFANSLILTTFLGCNHESWQFYVSLACMMLAYVSGRYSEKHFNKFDKD